MGGPAAQLYGGLGSIRDAQRGVRFQQRPPLPTPPPSRTRRMFGAHLSSARDRCSSRERMERLSSPRSRLSTPRSRTARVPPESHSSFAAVYAQPRNWTRLSSPQTAGSVQRRPPPLSAPQLLPCLPLQLMEAGAPRPHTSAMPAGAASDAREPADQLGPETCNWSGAPSAEPKSTEVAQAAASSTPSRSVRPHEEGSWFDQDAWLRLRAERSRRKAAQLEEEKEHWRAVVHPWLVQKKEAAQETLAQKRLRAAREEHSQLQRQIEARNLAMREKATALLKDMRALLALDDLTLLGPMAARVLERQVEDLIATHEISPGLMEQIEHMHEELIRQLFESIDEDGSGLLDKDEVRLLASKLGTRLTDVQSQEALQEMTAAQSGGYGLFRQGDATPRGLAGNGDSTEASFGQFYAWWLKPDKKTALKPLKVHNTTYFSVTPL